jgi:hypothetical protein
MIALAAALVAAASRVRENRAHFSQRLSGFASAPAHMRER